MGSLLSSPAEQLCEDQLAALDRQKQMCVQWNRLVEDDIKELQRQFRRQTCVENRKSLLREIRLLEQTHRSVLARIDLINLHVKDFSLLRIASSNARSMNEQADVLRSISHGIRQAEQTSVRVDMAKDELVGDVGGDAEVGDAEVTAYLLGMLPVAPDEAPKQMEFTLHPGEPAVFAKVAVQLVGGAPVLKSPEYEPVLKSPE